MNNFTEPALRSTTLAKMMPLIERYSIGGVCLFLGSSAEHVITFNVWPSCLWNNPLLPDDPNLATKALGASPVRKRSAVLASELRGMTQFVPPVASQPNPVGALARPAPPPPLDIRNSKSNQPPAPKFVLPEVLAFHPASFSIC